MFFENGMKPVRDVTEGRAMEITCPFVLIAADFVTFLPVTGEGMLYWVHTLRREATERSGHELFRSISDYGFEISGEGGGCMRRRLSSVRWCGVGAAVLGLVMMGFGLYRGELPVVFTKAVNICLECIGIG